MGRLCPEGATERVSHFRCMGIQVVRVLVDIVTEYVIAECVHTACSIIYPN